MKRSLKDNRGVALILTILIVSLIVSLTLEFNASMRSELHAAANLRDGIRLSCIARSAFNYALAVLFEDALESEFDSLLEVWADSKTLSANSTSMFEDGRFEVQITDHHGRININQLVDSQGKYNTKQKEMLTRLLGSKEFDLDPEEVGNVIDAIKDWIDPDSEVTRFGAENAYYQGLQKPYSCKNGLLESLEELLRIRGITNELFYGTHEKPGIWSYSSIYGDGKININTADPLVLRSLSDQIDEDMVENLINYRKDEENNLSDPKWYQKVPGMSHVSIDPDLITVSSTIFELKAEGIRGTMSKRIRGMVERGEGPIKILCWKVE